MLMRHYCARAVAVDPNAAHGATIAQRYSVAWLVVLHSLLYNVALFYFAIVTVLHKKSPETSQFNGNSP